MTIHRIRLLGDPILYTRCEAITKPRSAAVRVVVDDLRETLRDAQSRYGMGRAIAAPQIGAPVRIVYAELARPLVLINPEIVEVGSEDFQVWDDCYSFPNLFVRVLRAYRIRVRYMDVKGETHEVELERDMAELVQHEIDHLDGVLAIDRPHGPHPLALREEWNRMYTDADRYGQPEPRMAQVGPVAGALL
jgi:peptide deformylase